MSAEAEVTEGLQQPLDQNAQSAEDVKKMLAELDGEAVAKKEGDSKDTVKTEEQSESKVNGSEPEVKDEATADKENDAPVKDEDGDRSPDRRRGDRFDRGGRGRGRGRGRGGRGGFTNRNYRDNIKSDLTSQEESNDPVAIRRQVNVLASLQEFTTHEAFRLSSTSRTPIFLEINSFLLRLVEARTIQSS